MLRRRSEEAAVFSFTQTESGFLFREVSVHFRLLWNVWECCCHVATASAKTSLKYQRREKQTPMCPLCYRSFSKEKTPLKFSVRPLFWIEIRVLLSLLSEKLSVWTNSNQCITSAETQKHKLFRDQIKLHKITKRRKHEKNYKLHQFLEVEDDASITESWKPRKLKAICVSRISRSLFPLLF